MADDGITISDEEDSSSENEGGGQEGSIIEAQVINTVLNKQDFSIIASNGLDYTYFPGYEPEFKFIEAHFLTYKIVPDITTFLNKFPDFPSFDVNESESAMIFSIKEAKGYSLLAPALREIDELSKDNSIEAAKAMKSKAEEIIQEVSVQRFSSGIDIMSGADARYQEYLRRLALKGKLGTTFGLKTLDDATGGVWNNDFLGIVGRPGQGKSWIMEYLLLKPWKLQGKSILLFSLENSKEVVGFRADSLLDHFSNFSLMTGCDVVDWDNGKPVRSTEDYHRYIEDLSKSTVPFEVLDSQDSISGSFTIEDILEIAKQKKPDIIGIDQLSLISTAKRYHTIREGYIHTTRTIRQAVNELQIPIYLNCQAGREAAKMGRGKESTTPELEQIAESDSVGQDATKILSIHNQDGIIKVSLKKNTNGRSNVDCVMAWDIDRGLLQPTTQENMDDKTAAF